MERSRAALIIEDDMRWQERYAKTLTEAGYTVASATTPDEAILQLIRRRFDLAIVDMNLSEGVPQSEGLKVLNEIRERDKHTGIIVSTGYPTVELAVEGFEKYHIDRFYEKRNWAPDAFSALINDVLRRQPAAEPEQTLMRPFNFDALGEKLGTYWYRHKSQFRLLLTNIGLHAEPFISDTLTPVSTIETPGSELVQILGWSRGLGMPVAVRLGKASDIKHESSTFNSHGSLLATLPRRTRKIHPPYYQGEVGALLLETVDASLGPMNALATLYRAGQFAEFLDGLRDLLYVTCSSLYGAQKPSEQRMDPSLAFKKHVEELARRREKRIRRERDERNRYLMQLEKADRDTEEKLRGQSEEEKRARRIGLGFPVHKKQLLDPIAVLGAFNKSTRVMQTLVSQQLSLKNAYVDKDRNTWLIYGGWLLEDSPIIELAQLETQIKFSLMPILPIAAHLDFETNLDATSQTPSTELNNGNVQTAIEAVGLIRTFARSWQRDERLYRFLLALQAARISEETSSPDKEEAAYFSASWHASQLLV